MNRSVPRLVIAAIALSIVLSTPTRAFDKTFDKTYPLQSGGTFDLQNVNGTVAVEGWNRDEIEIHAVKTARDKETDLDRVSIDVEAKASALAVVTRYPQDQGVEVAVDYTVHVPYSAHVARLSSVNGALRISGVEAVEEMHTVNGNIFAFGAGPTVHARTTNGNIHLELTHLSRESHGTMGAAADTTNGSVVVAMAADSQADLEAHCMNGSFSTELPLSMESNFRRPRELRGKLGKGGTPVRLRTVNGAIRLVLLRSTV